MSEVDGIAGGTAPHYNRLDTFTAAQSLVRNSFLARVGLANDFWELKPQGIDPVTAETHFDTIDDWFSHGYEHKRRLWPKNNQWAPLDKASDLLQHIRDGEDHDMIKAKMHAEPLLVGKDAQDYSKERVYEHWLNGLHNVIGKLFADYVQFPLRDGALPFPVQREPNPRLQQLLSGDFRQGEALLALAIEAGWTRPQIGAGFNKGTAQISRVTARSDQISRFS